MRLKKINQKEKDINMTLEEQLKLDIVIIRLSREKTPYNITCKYLLDTWYPLYKKKTSRDSRLTDLLSSINKIIPFNITKEESIRMLERINTITEYYVSKNKRKYYMNPDRFLKFEISRDNNS